MSKVVHYHVYNPASALFKPDRNARASTRSVECSCESCPLLAMGQCVSVSIIGQRCPYGKVRGEDGPTRRARNFSTWVREHEAEAKKHGALSAPQRKLAFIGEWVWLPYPHMNSCQQVPFPSHGGFMVPGSDFLHREHWTVESVCRLLDHRPQAVFGGEIVAYQREQVPKFVQHVRECDPAMWEQLVALRPNLDTKPNYVGRTALLATLVAPFDIPPTSDKYPVRWHWDGAVLRTKDRSAYANTWGGIAAKAVSVEVAPAENATVVVADNSWVGGGTVFVD